MSRRDSRGISMLEFSLLLPWMVLMFLGTIAIGINLIRALQVVQLARDAGHLYARGLNFNQPGNKKILQTVGQTVGLDVYTPGNSQSVVYLSTVTYVDNWTCKAGGKADNSDPPNPVGCTNHGLWVFTTPQLRFGSTTVLPACTYGTPSGMTPDATTGRYLASDYVTKVSARVSSAFYALNLSPDPGTESAVVPANQDVYLSEAAISGFAVPGVNYTGPPLKAYGVF